MSDSVFVDTWGWPALGHHRDARHHEIKALYKELRSGGAHIYTSDYVLDERISFTDLTSMALMEEQGIKKALTEDEHFLQVGMGLLKIP
jgi:predicted nucleic acid-binding protein